MGEFLSFAHPNLCVDHVPIISTHKNKKLMVMRFLEETTYSMRLPIHLKYLLPRWQLTVISYKFFMLRNSHSARVTAFS